jgi:hypothetical protein
MADPSNRSPEPEIIPPGAPLPRDRGLWATIDTPRTQYVYTSRIGPVGLGLLILGVGAVAVLGFFFLISAAVIGLAAIGLTTIAAIVSGILRKPDQPLG